MNYTGGAFCYLWKIKNNMAAIQTLIDAYIKRNGNQEITGPVLNGVLKAIADALATPFIGDDGYWYIYDADTGDFVRTDTQATGPTGPEGPPGITSASVSVDANTGTPSVDASIVNKVLTLAFHNLKGAPGTPGTPGAAAGFGTPSATVDANTGTPSVQIAASGPDTAKVFAFTFKNLKGTQGNPGTPGAAAGFGTPSASVDANTGTPAVTVSASGPDTAKVFSFAFRNLKGATGNPGTPGAAAGFGTPTASVDSNTGTPSVQVSASGPDTAKVFNFAFRNLKGAQGNPGTAAGFGTPTASVDSNTGTPSVQVTPSGPDTAKVFDFAFHNLKGAQGNPGTPGAAAGFGTPTASVDDNVGTPSVVITPSGPDTAKVFDFAFHNLKGAQGNPGSPGDSCAVPVATAIPADGLAANKHYTLGDLTGSVTIDLDTTTEVAGQMNIYSLVFTAGATAPTITWPSAITKWAGNCLDAITLAPVITGGNTYEVSIVDGLAVITEYLA